MTEQTTQDASTPAVDIQQDGQETENVDTLPDWVRAKLTKANNEAARYRNERNQALEKAREQVAAEFESKLAELTSAKEAAEAKLAETEINLVKLRAAFGVVAPEEESGSLFDKASEIAELIKGSSEEEITANAAKLRELFGSTATPTRVSAVDRTPAGKAEALALNGDPLTQSLKAALGL